MICVFDTDNTNYEGNGDAVLTPTKCSHIQAAAGKYDLTMEHPIDAEGKWAHLVPEAIIRAPVPIETIETAFSGMDVDVYKVNEDGSVLRAAPSEPTAIVYPTWEMTANYSVGSKVSLWDKNYQCIYWDDNDAVHKHLMPSGSTWWEKIATKTAGAEQVAKLKDGTELYYISGPEDGWYEMCTTYGLNGYIKASLVTYYTHLTPEQTQPRRITTQLFRIRTVNVDSKGKTVKVTAEHVSYDMSGNIVISADIHEKNPAMTLAWIESGLMMEYQGTIATDMTSDDDGLYTGNIAGKNLTYALLDPDKGVVSNFDAMYRRDNWDVFVLRKVNTDRGFRLVYGKNMLGANWKIRSDNLVTRVVPVAKDEDGADLYLDGTAWVDSEHIGEYPVVRMERLKVEGQVGKDDGTETGTNWTLETLRAKMQEKAEERFTVDKADLLVHEVTVDFEMMGDTEEYRALKDLEQVLLYDTVTAYNERIRMSVSLEVSEIEFDCIRGKIKALKMTNVNAYDLQSVAGFHVFNNSITPEKLTDETREIFGVVDGLNSTSTTNALSARAGKELRESIDAISGITVEDNLTSTSTTNALSANQGRVLNEKKVDFVQLASVAANSSKSYSLTNSSKVVLFLIGANENADAMLLVNASSSGALTIMQTVKGSGITVTKATRSITLANGTANTAGVVALVFAGSISNAT